MNLKEIVAEMRCLGITEYEFKDVQLSYKIVLGSQPGLVAAEASPADSTPEHAFTEPTPASEELSEAFKRLPLNYQNSTLYGGRLPKLSGY